MTAFESQRGIKQTSDSAPTNSEGVFNIGSTGQYSTATNQTVNSNLETFFKNRLSNKQEVIDLPQNLESLISILAPKELNNNNIEVAEIALGAVAFHLNSSTETNLSDVIQHLESQDNPISGALDLAWNSFSSSTQDISKFINILLDNGSDTVSEISETLDLVNIEAEMPSLSSNNQTVAISDLEKSLFIQKTQLGTLDMHPLVKEHIFSKLTTVESRIIGGLFALGEADSWG